MKLNSIRVYVGWDGRDAQAFKVAKNSLLKYTSIDVEIIPLYDHELRQKGYYRREYEVMSNGQRVDKLDKKPFSTDFSFTRHLVSALEKHENKYVLYTDPDVLWRDDISNLIQECQEGYAISCVKHLHVPKENTKALGVQTLYERKNWSSVMMINPSLNTELTIDAVNQNTGSWLHGFRWLRDHQIGSLPERWNWLEGWSPEDIEPSLVHYTRGTPDMVWDLPYAPEWWQYV